MAERKVYNFDEGTTPEYFEFILGGQNYRVRYPTTEEIEKVSDLIAEDKQNEIMDYIYSFIAPVNKEAPSIKDALKNKSILVRNKVQSAILKEFQRDE